NVFRVEDRWIPIEAPTATGNLVPTTHPYYFTFGTYDNQPVIRSTMVTDNMYLTDAGDAVYKYEGAHNYRAGLPQWQPWAFLTTDTTSGSPIVINSRTLHYTAFNAVKGQLTIAAAD